MKINLKKNQEFTARIDSITNLGFGVCRVGGAVVFVSSAVTGDVVRASIIKVASSYCIARVLEYIERSPLRDGGRCDNQKCRSCAYRDIQYSEELRIKREEVISDFKKAGLSDVAVDLVVPSPSLSEYRNKAQYPISRTRSGDYVIGFFAPKSHNVCEAARCPIAPRIFGDIIEVLRTFFKKYQLSVYEEESGKGLLRHIYLRRGEVSGEILLTLVITEDTIPHADELVCSLTSAFPDIVGILTNKNDEMTNVILGRSYKTLYGKDYITDTLSGVTLKLSAPSFYQVNHGAAELLYAKARELADLCPTDTLLDLYCGVGSIGLSMADGVSELFGIEIVESAVECAKENAAACGITNARFYTGDAADCEKMLARAEAAEGRRILPDVIVLDPPRSGCDERLLRFVSSLSPKRIVYISCNPSTLARDVAVMRKLGFSSGDVTPFDLFPGTGHVESVVRLERRLDVDMRR